MGVEVGVVKGEISVEAAMTMVVLVTEEHAVLVVDSVVVTVVVIVVVTVVVTVGMTVVQREARVDMGDEKVVDPSTDGLGEIVVEVVPPSSVNHLLVRQLCSSDTVFC